MSSLNIFHTFKFTPSLALEALQAQRFNTLDYYQVQELSV